MVWEDVLLPFRGSDGDKYRTWVWGPTLTGDSRRMRRTVPDLRLQNCVHVAWVKSWELVRLPKVNRSKPKLCCQSGGEAALGDPWGGWAQGGWAKVACCGRCPCYPITWHSAPKKWASSSLLFPRPCPRTGWTQTVQTLPVTAKACVQDFLESWHGHHKRWSVNSSSHLLSSVSPSLIRVTSGHRLFPFQGPKNFRKEVGVEALPGWLRKGSETSATFG